MKARIRKVVNAYGVTISKELMEKAGLKNGEVEMIVRGSAILIREAGFVPRKGWAEASKTIAEAEGSIVKRKA